MRAESDVIEQLRDYGAWLVDHPGLDLAAGPPARMELVEVTFDDEVVLDRPIRRARRPWLLAAAALAVVLAGFVLAVRRPSAPADQPEDTTPPAALYVLPDDDRSVTNAWRESGLVAPYQSMVVGTRDGGLIRDPIRVVLSATRLDPAGVTQWQLVTMDQPSGWLGTTGRPGDDRSTSDVVAALNLNTDLAPGSGEAICPSRPARSGRFGRTIHVRASFLRLRNLAVR